MNKFRNLFIEWSRPIVEAHDTPKGSSSKCYCEVCEMWDKHVASEKIEVKP